MIPFAPRILDYALNTLWQLPLLAAATWLLIRLTRPTTSAQHFLWIATLILAATLPLHGSATYIPTPNLPVSHSFTAPSSIQAPRRALLTRWRGMSGSTEADYSTTPSPLFSPHQIPIDKTLLTTIVRVWLLAFAINLIRLTAAWITSRLLIASATRNPEALDPAFLQSCADRLQIPVPEIRFLNSPCATPVVAGIFHPILLLPTHLAHDYELTAILLHEFAHIRRRDTLANAACRLIALPIAWHPITPLLHARIAQTREILCDTLAAQATGSSTAYARSLLTLARDLTQPNGSGIATLGLFPSTPTSTPRNSSALEERIMNLIAPAAPRLSHRAIRISAGIALVTAATLTAAAFHLQPASAAEKRQHNPTGSPTASLVRIYSRNPASSGWQLSKHPASTTRTSAVAAYSSTDNGATWQASALPPSPQQPQPPAAPPAPPAPSLRAVPPPLSTPFAPLSSSLPGAHPAPFAPLASAVLPAPPAPKPPLTPQVAPAPSVPAPIPAPAPAPRPAPKPTHHSRILIDGNQRDLTPAEQADLDKQLADINDQVHVVLDKHLLDEKQLKIQLKSLNTPEFDHQIDILQKQIESPEFQKQIAEASRLASDQAMTSDAMRQRIDQAMEQIKIAQANMAREHIKIKVDSAQMQQQLKSANEALAHIKLPADIDVHIDTADLQRQLDQAQKQIDEARKRLKDRHQ